MRNGCCRQLLLSCCLFVAVLLAGCAGQKSMVVLLPEDGKPPGEVTVVNAHGSQVLNRPWQAVEIQSAAVRPAAPVALSESKVHGLFDKVLSAMPAPPAHYLLFFKLNSAELVPESRLLLPVILTELNKRQPAELSVIGHTDTVESDAYNFQLGLQRANAVPALLKALGAAPAFVETFSRGKTDLLVKTGDQVLEPRNRRAEVTIR